MSAPDRKFDDIVPLLLPEGTGRWHDYVVEQLKAAGFSGHVDPSHADWNAALTSGPGLSIQRLPDLDGMRQTLDASGFKMATTNPRLMPFAFDAAGSETACTQFKRVLKNLRDKRSPSGGRAVRGVSSEERTHVARIPLQLVAPKG